ncbi:MAG: hypothetical protein R6W76_01505 [Caldilinea sp.]
MHSNPIKLPIPSVSSPAAFELGVYAFAELTPDPVTGGTPIPAMLAMISPRR